MSRCRFHVWIVVTALFLLDGEFALSAGTAQPPDAGAAAEDPPDDSAPVGALPEDWIKAFHWRSIGPANMGGRITAITVCATDPSIWWAATASGGLLKTTNNGTTFSHQFDREDTVSIGDVRVAPSDPNIVWVGTGEANPRNSVSWGNGVYRSTDGGQSWKHMGLENSFQVGRIAIHPLDPDTVYVGALGRLWGPNKERGLFKTTDGGASWTKVLYVDDDTGVIDVAMHPDDPNTLIVATYERRRDGFDTNDPATKWGDGSGLYKTSDGGNSWKKLTDGLPTGRFGRIGIDYYRKDPDIVYAVLESELVGKEPETAAFMGMTGETADAGARLLTVTENGPAEEAGLQSGDIVLTIDGKTLHSYEDLVREIRMRQAGDAAQFEISRERKSVFLEVSFAKRPEENPDEERAGDRRQRRSPFSSGLGGQSQNFQEQQGPEGHEHGGVYRSVDGGENWTRINSVNPRPMYFSQIRVDPSDDNYIYVLGVSLYRSSDGGKTFTADGAQRGVHVDHHALWIDPNDGRHMILGNDGGIYVTHDRMSNWDHHNHAAIGQFYHVTVGPRRDFRVYGGLQDNGSWGGPSRVRHDQGPSNADWISIGGGDGFICRVDPHDPNQIYFESQNGGMGRRNLRTGERARIRPRAPRGTRYRFNWKTPYVLSNHNSKIFYTAGNYVFRSYDRGNGLRRISGEITNTERGSATAFAESPRNSDVLYAGTDDGALWATRNGGVDWSPLFSTRERELAPDVTTATAGEKISTTTSQPPQEGGRRRGQMLERIRSLDADGDGKIQRAEVPERMARFFDRIDRNNDGVIDSAELESFAGRTPARDGTERRGRQTAPRGGTPSAHKDRDPISGEWLAKSTSEELPDEREFSFVLRLETDGKVTGTFSSDIGEGKIQNGKFDAESGRLRFSFESEQFPLDFTALVRGTAMEGEGTVGDGMFSFDFTAKRSQPKRQLPSGSLPEGRSDDEREPEPLDDRYEWQPLDALVPGPRWVSSIVASRFEEKRVYLALDGHRSDDDEPYLFVSENYGESWRSLRGNLPPMAGSTRAISEDLQNPNVLFLGTEFSAWVSIDRGGTWTKLNNNLPTVAIHDFALHPTADELVAATHGRSLWILDICALRQITPETVAAPATLYKPNPAIFWRSEPRRGRTTRRFVGENPPSGAVICYSLAKKTEKISLEIRGLGGDVVRTLDANAEPGFHRVVWDLRKPAPERSPSAESRRGFRGPRRGPRVTPGVYEVVLRADALTLSHELAVQIDPDHNDSEWLQYEDLEEQLFGHEEGEDPAASDRREH